MDGAKKGLILITSILFQENVMKKVAPCPS